MVMFVRMENQWQGVAGFAGFAIIFPAVAGAADPCTGAAA
jgi:hypothetical protein